MTELWRPTTIDPRYEVSTLGRIRRVAPGRGTRVGKILKHCNKDGDPTVWIGGRLRSVPRIVAAVWLVRPDVPGAVLRMKDGDRRNCAADNLVWALRPRPEHWQDGDLGWRYLDGTEPDAAMP